jgi:hypothetical protein
MRSEESVREKYWEVRWDKADGQSAMTRDFDLGYMDALEWVLNLKINPQPEWAKKANMEF